MSEEKLKKLQDLTNKFELSQIKGLSAQLNKFSLSDSQIAKKIIKTKMPNMTDEDLNLLVYGEDLKKKYGPKYKEFKSEKDKEQELDLERPPKTKKEKRQKDKKLFKPIPKESPIYDEVNKVKKEFKVKLDLWEKKSIALGKAVAQFGVQIGSTISAAAIIVLPPSFNVPGAITLTLSLVRSFNDLKAKLEDFLPITDIVSYVPLIVPDDKLPQVLGTMTKIMTTINTFSQTLNALSALMPSMSQAKQDALDKIQKQMDNKDKQIAALKPEDFETQSDLENRKKQLEKEKEALAKQANKLL